jgi:nitrogen fixation protein FixH
VCSSDLIAVNFVMARYAIATFGGTVVDNSYVASQKFNGWLEEARREKELGWRVEQPVREGKHLSVVIADALGQPLTGATVSVLAEHPLGRLADRHIAFEERASGTYISKDGLPAGRWKLRMDIRQAKKELNLAFEVE